jgi:hypothetical protein
VPRSTEHKQNKEQIKLNIRQLGEMIVRNEKIHEGLYDVTFDFQIGVGGVGPGPGPESLVPGATIGITGVGIIRAKVLGPLTIDASVVNPKNK